MYTLNVLYEDVGQCETSTSTFDTEDELLQFMNDVHGDDEFEIQLNTPVQNQYDETYYKTFTVTKS